jgi:hypothetical protein
MFIIKKSEKSIIQAFSFILLDDGRILANNDGSGSGRPENLRILWIRIQKLPVSLTSTAKGRGQQG